MNSHIVKLFEFLPIIFLWQDLSLCVISLIIKEQVEISNYSNNNQKWHNIYARKRKKKDKRKVNTGQLM